MTAGQAQGAIEQFDAIDVIRAKRDGGVVPEPALRWMVDAYTRGYVSDAQMASFAMAIFQRGMERDEIRVLTDAMIASGERMSFATLGKKTVDKHSTGGVGDKITLPLAPLVASFGVAVPQLSGRGLGHRRHARQAGVHPRLARCAQQRGDVRADAGRRRGRDLRRGVGSRARRQEALRAPRRHRHRGGHPADRLQHHVEEDRRRTDALVLDVKFGSGAFMQDIDRARELARTMVALGTDSGVATTALLTDMNVPLGRAIGNANEVRESVEILAGGDPLTSGS